MIRSREERNKMGHLNMKCSLTFDEFAIIIKIFKIILTDIYNIDSLSIC